ncbi:MAG: helix-turn-helix domain-containing protein [Smithellaceae bacterium]|jgi:hypothetical protein|nr:helix-turn-helix domain-containing protein [Syntrophaceae bacterium]MDD4240601.1 helix-turn-helix domain-containing protein [Smithellaceae bacterium]NLX53341.1 hypothetical protein [Deltaproteobacteria bacterium]
MQKGFDQLTYYEMLDIRPDAAPFEVRHAYNAALSMYQPGALASYSFFSEEERQEILSLIETAYRTLISDQARREYDEELIRRGELDVRPEAPPPPKKTAPCFDISRAPVVKAVFNPLPDYRDRIRQSELIGGILAKGELRGADLKQIRTELGVAVEQIAKETKIRRDHLLNMEEDRIARLPATVFLKGFVKSYLKCLCVEPVEELSARYMKTVSSRSPS